MLDLNNMATISHLLMNSRTGYGPYDVAEFIFEARSKQSMMEAAEYLADKIMQYPPSYCEGAGERNVKLRKDIRDVLRTRIYHIIIR